jgi:hypothetical protein
MEDQLTPQCRDFQPEDYKTLMNMALSGYWWIKQSESWSGLHTERHPLSKFLNKVNAIHTVFVKYTEFEVSKDPIEQKMQIEHLNKEVESFEKEMNDPSFDGSVMDKHFGKSFSAWLVLNNRTESIKMLAIYPHLLNVHISYWPAMMAATLPYIQTSHLESFKLLYSKGVRNISMYDSQICATHEVHLDPYDGGIPYWLIHKQDKDVLVWYIQERLQEPNYKKEFSSIIASYLKTAAVLFDKENRDNIEHAKFVDFLKEMMWYN